uniref:glucose-1-phosphate adenylyltransferase n=1 Tax=Oryza rufipogon TaxID=4529 RepID=A0A0E0R5G1_ORYRU
MLSLPLSCPLAPLGGVPDLLLGSSDPMTSVSPLHSSSLPPRPPPSLSPFPPLPFALHSSLCQIRLMDCVVCYKDGVGALGLWGGQATAARPGRRGVGRESGSSATTTTTTLARHDGCDGEGHYPAATQMPGEAAGWFRDTADAVENFFWALEHILSLSGDQLYRMDYMKLMQEDIGTIRLFFDANMALCEEEALDVLQEGH